LDFPDEGHERRSDVPRLTDELDAALERAVRRRLRSDAPIGTYLSGGVDSSTVLAIARQNGASTTAFTIQQDGSGPNEAAEARSVAQQLDTPLRLCPMNPGSVAEALPEVTIAAESPVVDTSSACLLRLARDVRDAGFKVALCGEGADEALGGYSWFGVERVFGSRGPLRSLREPLRRLLFGAIASPLHGEHRGLADLGVHTAQYDFHEPLRRARSLVYGPRLNGAARFTTPLDELQLDPIKIRRWHPLHRSLYVEYRLMLPCLLLATKGDRVSMGGSVEARYPFLDEDVVDLCASLAPEYKTRGLQGKWLLRQVARRRLGASVANRPKRMLRSTRSALLLGDGRPAWVDELLSEASLARTELFDPRRVNRQRWLQTHLPAISPTRIVMDATLTAVLASQLFCHQFLGGNLCSLPTWSPPKDRRSPPVKF
jgi:asparagine synthase (glutamine-hydrolysing)